MEEEKQTPRVFISYSHDSPEHKKWVSELASKLMENGIDIILDQWELELGGDVPKFMENSVYAADRVLMICTETYVHKADDGLGGVGYEAMIITGELFHKLGTSKFIPIIKQKNENPILPKFMGIRKYIDISNEEAYQKNIEELIRGLHKFPAYKKPPIGKNPFITNPDEKEILEKTGEGVSGGIKASFESHLMKVQSGIFQDALSIAEGGDIIAWRQLIQSTRKNIVPALSNWQSKYANKNSIDSNELAKAPLEGAEIYSPLIKIALAGVGSGKSKFNNQLSLIEYILFPKKWNLSGFSTIVDVPEFTAFIYQALHGAMCLYTDQLNIAVQFARATIEQNQFIENIPIWQNYGIIGWPRSLSQDVDKAWKVLSSLPEYWPWLLDVFGDDYEACLVAYYMALHIIEYTNILASKNLDILKEKSRSLHIPLTFLSYSNEDIQREAYRFLSSDPEQIKNIWRSLDVEDVIASKYWNLWFEGCKSWLPQSYLFGLRGQALNFYKKMNDLFI
jgi:hypothetical protein